MRGEGRFRIRVNADEAMELWSLVYRNRGLGKILKTYVDVANEKLVDDTRLNDALFTMLERMRDVGYTNSVVESQIRRALNSDDAGYKISALDSSIHTVHRDGLLWGKSELTTPKQLETDVTVLLDKLWDEEA